MTWSRRTPSKPEAPVLPWPLSTRPRGCAPAPRCVRPPWFSKPASTRDPLSAGQAHLDRDVADQPRAVLAHRVQVDEPDPGDPLVAELVVVAEELVAAAHGEDDAAGVGRGVQRVALGVDHVLGAQRLVAVLGAADVEEVVRVGVDALAEPCGDDLEADPAPLRSGARAAAGCRGRRRCS